MKDTLQTQQDTERFNQLLSDMLAEPKYTDIFSEDDLDEIARAIRNTLGTTQLMVDLDDESPRLLSIQLTDLEYDDVVYEEEIDLGYYDFHNYINKLEEYREVEIVEPTECYHDSFKNDKYKVEFFVEVGMGLYDASGNEYEYGDPEYKVVECEKSDLEF